VPQSSAATRRQPSCGDALRSTGFLPEAAARQAAQGNGTATRAVLQPWALRATASPVVAQSGPTAATVQGLTPAPES